jgi:outer membrane scaffolding protein for murein synthesis (MipA/OmpV family)
MQNRFIVVAMMLCAMPVAAHGPGATEAVEGGSPHPDWSVTLGGGAIVAPSYPGSGSSRVLPLPYLDLRHRDWLFVSSLAGIGVNAPVTPSLRLGVAVLPDLGRSASAADRLRGWGDLGMGAIVKLFGTYSLGGINLLADVRRQFGAGNGTLIDAGVTSVLPLARRLILFPTATVTWANARLSRAYFGIDANQSATAFAQGSMLPVYSAGAGFRDTALAVMALVPLTDRLSVHSLLRAEMLLGDAAGSPLTTQRIQPTVGGFLAWRL